MKPHEVQPISFLALPVALTCGVFSGVAVFTALVVLGVFRLEALVFSILASVVVVCFVWIERRLTRQLKVAESQLSAKVDRARLVRQERYTKSLACYVRFDAGTLIVDSASPGFMKMLRYPTDTQLRGRRLEEVIGVNALKLESLVDLIKGEDAAVKQPKVTIRDAHGFTANAFVSGTYDEAKHIIEAAFLIPPVQNAERAAELDAVRKDLDRFRQGMFRRERRILELKEEVNLLLREADESPRYLVDRSSDDSDVVLKSLSQLERGQE